jgi:hypothetical protein
MSARHTQRRLRTIPSTSSTIPITEETLSDQSLSDAPSDLRQLFE